MKNRVISGVIVIIAGILFILIPYFILPVCEHMPNMPIMKCFWTARVELGLGIVIIFGGILLLLFRHLYARMGVCLMLLAVAVLALTVPVGLVGVCPMPNMPCRMGTLPGLVVLSILLILFLLGNLFYLYKKSQRGCKG